MTFRPRLLSARSAAFDAALAGRRRRRRAALAMAAGRGASLGRDGRPGRSAVGPARPAVAATEAAADAVGFAALAIGSARAGSLLL